MKFNQTQSTTKTTNYAGGAAYQQTPKVELVSILLTSFVKSQFYRSEDETLTKVRELVRSSGDKKFIAKAALYARNEFGMRSISHVVAGELAEQVKGEQWTRNFFDRIVHRPDDMLEILGYYYSNYREYIPNAVKKGFAKAIGRFDEYQLAKYRGEKKSISLVDVVNAIHPKPTGKNATALKLLISGELRSHETWETKLTQAGQNSGNDTDKAHMKSKAWRDLVLEKKLGYMALLKNLRNIIQQCPEVVDAVCEQLVDEQKIRKSLVLPFRFITAANEINELAHDSVARKVLAALGDATGISVKNVPMLPGKTLVALDSSGSMLGKPSQIGALFAGAFAKSENDVDIMLFSDNARYIAYNPNDSLTTIVANIPFLNGGTNFHSIFQTANKKYDRIIILSDMQAWAGYQTPHRAHQDYIATFGTVPKIYSFDLAGYGTMQFPEKNVYALAGFSDKIFSIMGILEQDPDALIHEIEKIDL